MSVAAEFPLFLAWLERVRGCPQGIEWACGSGSILNAADQCPSSEWLLWTVQEAGFADAAVGRGFSVACLRYVEDLLVDPRQTQAVARLRTLADRAGSEPDRLEAARLATEAASELMQSPRWSIASAAAGAALWHAADFDAWGAVAEVRRQSLRALAWNPLAAKTVAKADRELAQALRRLLGPYDQAILSGIRARLAEKVPEPPDPCKGC